MANLMITTACNFSCSYCFGLDMIGRGHPVMYMEMDLFRKLTQWILNGSKQKIGIHLMGGEPTLHPGFPLMIRELTATGRIVKVFSNASTPLDDRVFEESAELGVTWVVNTNLPETFKGGQLELLKRHLRILGSQAALTFNVTNRNIPSDFLFSFVDEYKLDRKLKIGVALPTMSQNNVFVKKESFGEIADAIMELHAKACAARIEVAFECGVPYCLFSPEQHKELAGVNVSHCGSRLDITPLGNVINCLPLSKMAQPSYSEFADYGEAQAWFRKAADPFHSLGWSNDCVLCKDLMRGKCRVCLAYGMNSYNKIAVPPLPHAN